MELFSLLKDIADMQHKRTAEYQLENDEWWNNLTESEREHAFYAVVKRIIQGIIEENGSYRHVLYNVFEFQQDMYGAGMDCGYMSIHNLIKYGIDYDKMRNINRFEVIDDVCFHCWQLKFTYTLMVVSL